MLTFQFRPIRQMIHLMPARRDMAGCMIEEHIVALVGLVQTIISKNIAKYFVR